jgi:GH25 family lysozyme M1 (1,4-beta-N-acetylmuramidase)
MISTTADGWTVDTTKAAFLGVTAHWIEVDNNKWNMLSEVIGFRSLLGEHNGENLGRYFVGVCDCIGIIDSKQSKVNQPLPTSASI